MPDTTPPTPPTPRDALAAVALSDVFVGAGLALLAWGAWLIYPPAALLLVGAVLFVAGVIGTLWRAD